MHSIVRSVAEDIQGVPEIVIKPVAFTSSRIADPPGDELIILPPVIVTVPLTLLFITVTPTKEPIISPLNIFNVPKL